MVCVSVNISFFGESKLMTFDETSTIESVINNIFQGVDLVYEPSKYSLMYRAKTKLNSEKMIKKSFKELKIKNNAKISIVDIGILTMS